MKDGRKKLIALSLLAALCCAPAAAFAQCESSSAANQALQNMANENKNDLNNYIKEVEKYVDRKLTDNAEYEMTERLSEFDDNIRAWLSDWKDNRLIPTMKVMAKQLSIAQVDQTRQLGAMMDTSLLNDVRKNTQAREEEARHRYMPSEMTCQADTTGPAQVKAHQMSRALNRGYAKDSVKSLGNAKGTPGATGRSAEIKSQWDEYVSVFCDPDNGDQGCGTTPGSRPGTEKDMAGLLWGSVQTIDASSAENRAMLSGALRYLVAPAANNPIPPNAIDSAGGREAMLDRRAALARNSAVYNVVGQMLAERVSVPAETSLSDVFRSLRTGAGLPNNITSDNPSYSELRQAITKERFSDPAYITRLVNSPEEVMREQGSVNALRLQLMNDLYRRQEEQLFMEAAMYSHDLDRQKPPTAVSAGTIK